MSKNLFVLVICAIFAEAFWYVPVIGAMCYGVAIQVLDALAVANHWYWLDMNHWWNGFISWLLLSSIFFGSYKAIAE